MNITPDWIVGFVDGQGIFSFEQSNDQTYDFCFVLNIHKKSVCTLYDIKTFFKCGSIHKVTQTTMQFKVTSQKHLIEKIIPFFDKHALKTTKQTCFKKFAHKCLCLNGIDYDPQTHLRTRRFEEPANDLTLDWLIGFIDAKGCFVCRDVQNQLRCQLVIGLNRTDNIILDQIQNYLGCGTCYNLTNGVTLFQLKSQKEMYLFVTKYLLTCANRDRLRTHKRIVARKWSRMVVLRHQNKPLSVVARNKIYKTYYQFKKLLKP